MYRVGFGEPLLLLLMLLLSLVGLVVGLFALYLAIRFGVRHGIRDAYRQPSPSSPPPDRGWSGAPGAPGEVPPDVR